MSEGRTCVECDRSLRTGRKYCHIHRSLSREAKESTYPTGGINYTTNSFEDYFGTGFFLLMCVLLIGVLFISFAYSDFISEVRSIFLRSFFLALPFIPLVCACIAFWKWTDKRIAVPLLAIGVMAFIYVVDLQSGIAHKILPFIPLVCAGIAFWNWSNKKFSILLLIIAFLTIIYLVEGNFFANSPLSRVSSEDYNLNTENVIQNPPPASPTDIPFVQQTLPTVSSTVSPSAPVQIPIKQSLQSACDARLQPCSGRCSKGKIVKSHESIASSQDVSGAVKRIVDSVPEVGPDEAPYITSWFKLWNTFPTELYLYLDYDSSGAHNRYVWFVCGENSGADIPVVFSQCKVALNTCEDSRCMAGAKISSRMTIRSATDVQSGVEQMMSSLNLDLSKKEEVVNAVQVSKDYPFELIYYLDYNNAAAENWYYWAFCSANKLSSLKWAKNG